MRPSDAGSPNHSERPGGAPFIDRLPQQVIDRFEEAQTRKSNEPGKDQKRTGQASEADEPFW